MAANKKFTPKASTNPIGIEEVTETEAPIEETAEESVPVEAPVPVEDKPEEKKSEVTFTAKTESKPIESKVKIRLARDYKGCIGGVWYYFKKDEVAIVPESVKLVLNRAEGMLKPL
jgi:hypothetical protein